MSAEHPAANLLPCTCHSDDLEPYCPRHTSLPGEDTASAAIKRCMWAFASKRRCKSNDGCGLQVGVERPEDWTRDGNDDLCGECSRRAAS